MKDFNSLNRKDKIETIKFIVFLVSTVSITMIYTYSKTI